jgi:hypothetical protein
MRAFLIACALLFALSSSEYQLPIGSSIQMPTSNFIVIDYARLTTPTPLEPGQLEYSLPSGSTLETQGASRTLPDGAVLHLSAKIN